MQPLPHQYRVTASAQGDDNIILRGEDLPELVSAPPAEFDGPGDKWSPEELLAAALADSFILTFRAIANDSRFEWCELECAVEGVLDKVKRTLRFTEFTLVATLTVAAGSDQEQAEKLLRKAARNCLISKSLTAKRNLVAVIHSRD